MVENESKFLNILKKKAVLIIIVGIVVLGGYLVVSAMSCELVDYITLEVELPGDFRTKLTKDCYNEKILSTIPQEVIRDTRKPN